MVRVVFFASPKERELDIGQAFCAGVQAHGDTACLIHPADYDGPQSDTDVAVFVGVKGWSRLLMETHIAAGKHAIICDKGYFGGSAGPRSKYIRCSIDALQPLAYFQKTPRPHTRLHALDVNIAPWKKTGTEVILAGGSLKYARWHQMPMYTGLDPATGWAIKTFHRVRKHTQRPIVYSPKPSFKNAVPIEGMRFVQGVGIEKQLQTAWCLVTFGSNAAVDAIIAGVPVFIPGDGIAKPMGLDDVAQVEQPFYPTDEQRWQFLADVSFCQFSAKELASGFGWSILRPQILLNAEMRRQAEQ